MVDDGFTQPKMFFLSDHCISFLIRTDLKDFRARESAQKEGIHGLPRAQDGQPPQWARTLQEQMFNARGAERRPHVADQEATGVTPISHLLLFHVLHSFIHSFIFFLAGSSGYRRRRDGWRRKAGCRHSHWHRRKKVILKCNKNWHGPCQVRHDWH